jgi:hypothetical protein
MTGAESAVQSTLSEAQLLEKNDPTRAKMALERAVGKQEAEGALITHGG